MLTNKDIRVADGNIVINGDKYPLASQAEIDVITDTIGDITQTGLTGDSVAAQLETAKGQIADVTSGIEKITRKDLTANDENAFLTLAYADILSDMGAYVAEAPKCVTRLFTWYGHDTYVINAYRIHTNWIYSFCFKEGKAYYITYDCTNNSIIIKKSFTLTETNMNNN